MQALGKVWNLMGGSSQNSTLVKISSSQQQQPPQGFRAGSYIYEEPEEEEEQVEATPATVNDTPKKDKRKKKKRNKLKLKESSPAPLYDEVQVQATAEEVVVGDEEVPEVEDAGHKKKKRKRGTDREGAEDGEKKRKKKKKKRQQEVAEGEEEVVSLRRVSPVFESEVQEAEIPAEEEELHEEHIPDTIKKRKQKGKKKKEPSEAIVEETPPPEEESEPQQRSESPEDLIIDSSEEDQYHEDKEGESEDEVKEEKPIKTPKGKTPRRRETEGLPRGRRRGFVPDTPRTPAQVIIPLALDSTNPNSRGVAAPPPPAEYERGPYTEEEENLIHNVVQRYCSMQIPVLTRDEFIKRIWENGSHKTDFWNILMTNLPHRNRNSLYSHVKRSYNNFAERGVWTEEQDVELAKLVEEKGNKWSLIGQLTNRMPGDCRDRWRNYLVCGENRKKNYWSAGEEIKLLDAIDECLGDLVDFHVGQETLILEVGEDETEEEMEERLKEEKAYHRDEIDWGLVSQKLGHSRSRLQCLQKAKQLWSKFSSTIEDEDIREAINGKGTQRTPKRKPKKSDPYIVDSDTPPKKRGRKRKQVEKEDEVGNLTLIEGSKMLPGDYLYIMRQISVQGYDCLASIDWNKIVDLDVVKHFTAEQFKAGFHKYMVDNNPQKKDLRAFVAQQLEEMQDLPAMQRNKRFRPPAGSQPKPLKTTPVEPEEPRKARKSSKSKPLSEELQNGEKSDDERGNPFYDQSTLDLIDQQVGKKSQRKKKRVALPKPAEVTATPSKTPKSQSSKKALGKEIFGSDNEVAQKTPPKSIKSHTPKIVPPKELIEDEDVSEGDSDVPRGVVDDDIEDYDSEEGGQMANGGGSEADDEGADATFWG